MNKLALENIEDLLLFFMQDQSMLFSCLPNSGNFMMKSYQVLVRVKFMEDNANYCSLDIGMLKDDNVIGRKNVLVPAIKLQKFFAQCYQRLNDCLNRVYRDDQAVLQEYQTSVARLLSNKVNPEEITKNNNDNKTEVVWRHEEPKFYVYRAKWTIPTHPISEYAPTHLECSILERVNPDIEHGDLVQHNFAVIIPNKDLHLYPMLELSPQPHEAEEDKLQNLINDSRYTSALAQQLHLQSQLPNNSAKPARKKL